MYVLGNQCSQQNTQPNRTQCYLREQNSKMLVLKIPNTHITSVEAGSFAFCWSRKRLRIGMLFARDKSCLLDRQSFNFGRP